MLGWRTVTVLVGAPIVLLSLHAGGPVWALVIAVLAVWGALELGDLFLAKGTRAPRDVLVLAGLSGVALAPLMQRLSGTHWVGAIALLLPFVVLSYASLRAWLRRTSLLLEAGAAAFAFSYVGVLMGFWWLLRMGSGLGWPYALTAITGTWATDIGAFFAGRTLGHHALLPRVSPGKTVEGAAGGLALGVIVASGLAVRLIGMDALSSVGLGLVVAVTAEIGDLVESALKRDANVKDSGWLLPGHGGILDRIDSMLMAGFAAYLFVVLVARL